MTPAKGSARMFHLDALRAFCMFYGVLAHGATIDHNGEFFLTFIRTLSNLFRMGTFFLIAGYFTALAVSKGGGRDYFSGRSRILLVPLVTTLLTLVPITNYLIHLWHNGPMTISHYFFEGGWREPSLGKDVWHLHLWFLFSLFTYAVVAPTSLQILRRPAVAAAISRFVQKTGRWVLWSTAVILALAVVGMRVIYSQILQPFTVATPFDYIVAATLTYLPYFILGMMMFVNKTLFEALHRINWIGLLLCAGMFLLATYAGSAMPMVVNRVVLWIGKSGAILFIISALLRIFALYVNKPSRVLSLLVDSAFTFYLVHLTIIYLVANIVKPFVQNINLVFLVIILVVPPVALLIHFRLVAPSRLLRYLYNGKRAKRDLAPATTGS